MARITSGLCALHRPAWCRTPSSWSSSSGQPEHLFPPPSQGFPLPFLVLSLPVPVPQSCVGEHGRLCTAPTSSPSPASRTSPRGSRPCRFERPFPCAPAARSAKGFCLSLRIRPSLPMPLRQRLAPLLALPLPLRQRLAPFLALRPPLGQRLMPPFRRVQRPSTARRHPPRSR